MRFALVCCGVALLAAGCGKRPVEIGPGEAVAMASRWNGNLAAPADMAGVIQIRGTTWMAADGNRTHARIDVSNAVPGAEHPWHVHRGRCGSNGPIVGKASDYKLLKVGGDGKANSEAHLDVSFPNSGEFFVNIHALPTNLQTIVACANLAAPTR